MNKLALAVPLVVVLVVSALAQTQEREYELKVNIKEIELIDKALSSMPYREVASLMVKLQQQIAVQNLPARPVPQPNNPK